MPYDRIPFLESLGSIDGASSRRVWKISAPARVAACFVAILLILGLYRLSRDQREADVWVSHTLTVLERIALLEADLANTVAEGRGFLLDPVPERLSRAQTNVAAVREDVAALTILTADNEIQQDEIRQLTMLVDARITALCDIMQLASSSNLSEVARTFKASTAISLAVRVHQGIVDLRDEERSLLVKRTDIATSASRNLLLALVGTSLLALISVVGGGAVLLRRRQEQVRYGIEQLHLSDLRRERDRFEAAVKAVHGVIWTNDAQGCMFGEQPGWAALTGQIKGQYQGLGWTAAVHPEDAGPTVTAWNSAVADHRMFVFEHRVRCADGVYRIFAIRAAPVVDTTGEVREWVGIHTDVTSQRMAELSNVRLASIVAYSQDAIISFTPDNGQILSWNTAAERLFGYSETEAVGELVELLLPLSSQEIESSTSVFDVAKSGRNIVAYETTRATKSGEQIPIAVTATRMLAPDSRLLGVSVTFYDLRPRRQVENALRDANTELEQRVEERTTELVANEAKLSESEAGYRLLAEHGSDMIARLGSDGTWQYASPAAVCVLGRDPATMLGCSPLEIVHPDDQAEVETFFSHLRTGAMETGTLTIRAVHLTRGEFWIEIAARTLVDNISNQSVGSVASLRDVTDRRRLESERESQAKAVRIANDELEQSNRTLDRLARHLARARDQANAASRAKSRFLASMSHELRTPLNGILGYAHLLRTEGQLNPLQTSRVETMLTAGQHLLEMISGVLSLSEVEQQHVELKSEAVDLGKLALESADFVRPSAQKKKLSLTVEILLNTPVVAVTDPTRLRQILLNLLGNAVKFTATGSVTLRLCPVPVHPGQDHQTEAYPVRGEIVRFEVADTGPGIPQEKRQRLFREFERLAADPDALEGAGLGLALSARLVTVMGGSIGHTDNDGGGSIFWVEMPLRQSDIRTEQTDIPIADITRRVLIVDDVAMNRDVAASFLKGDSYDVTCLDNGADAVVAAGHGSFDVILMDVRMPAMDGLEATRRIRALPAPHCQVPVVALTAQAFADQVAECRNAGMDIHLTKPFSPDALRAAIAQAIESGCTRSTTSFIPAEAELDPDRPIIDETTFDLTSSCLSSEDVGIYLQALATRASTLQSRLAQFDLVAPEHDPDIAAFAHALAGSAGMFGFSRLSSVAQRLEYVLASGVGELDASCKAFSATLVATGPELSRRIIAFTPTVSVAAGCESTPTLNHRVTS